MSEMEVDKSHLPRVYDVCQCFTVMEDGALAHSLQEQEIEQFYSTNVQRNQAVQSDVRLARRLQQEEDDQRTRLRRQRLLEEQDCKYAKMIQEELRLCEEEARRREEEDEEMARRLQEKEEVEARRQRSETGCQADGSSSPLSDGLEVWVQCLRDAELAQRLQEEEEEENRQIHKKDSHMDFRAAQVAQDEELARYMQRQERSNRRSQDAETLERTHRDRDPVRAANRNVQPLHMARERLNSEGLHSPVDEELPPSTSCTDLHRGQMCLQVAKTCGNHKKHTPPIRNIAEELDPTFTARKRESKVSSSPPSGVCLAPRTPHSIFYDYLPEPAFVPPTKRQGDKPGRPKAKEKRETCKQQ